jgi:hypothetical protein
MRVDCAHDRGCREHAAAAFGGGDANAAAAAALLSSSRRWRHRQRHKKQQQPCCPAASLLLLLVAVFSWGTRRDSDSRDPSTAAVRHPARHPARGPCLEGPYRPAALLLAAPCGPPADGRTAWAFSSRTARCGRQQPGRIRLISQKADLSRVAGSAGRICIGRGDGTHCATCRASRPWQFGTNNSNFSSSSSSKSSLQGRSCSSCAASACCS